MHQASVIWSHNLPDLLWISPLIALPAANMGGSFPPQHLDYMPASLHGSNDLQRITTLRKLRRGDRRHVTAPLLTDEPNFASEARGSWTRTRRSRDANASSLLWARTKRAAHRQVAVLVIVFILATGVGVLYEFAAGVPALEPLPLCLAIALVVALAIAFISELGRNTVTSVAG